MMKNKYIVIGNDFEYNDNEGHTGKKFVTDLDGKVLNGPVYVDSLEEAKNHRKLAKVTFYLDSRDEEEFTLNYSNALVFDADTKEIVSDPGWLFETERKSCYTSEMIKSKVKVKIDDEGFEYFISVSGDGNWWTTGKSHFDSEPAKVNLHKK